MNTPPSKHECERTVGLYRVGVIGLGHIGAGRDLTSVPARLGTLMPHSHMAAVLASPSLELVAVCDSNLRHVERCVSDWAIAERDCRQYSDYREMLTDGDLDIVTVAVPDDLHAEVVVAAAASGVQGILCEKPLATTVSDATAAVSACKASAVSLLVNHTRRWIPPYVLAREAIASGAIGDLDHIIASFGGPRAMLFRNGSHLVDAIGFFSQSEPEWLSARLDDDHADYPPRYAGDGGTDPSTDPGVTAIIKMKNGVRGMLHLSKGAIATFECDLVGSKGRLRLGSDASELWRQSASGDFSITAFRAPVTTRADTLAALEELASAVARGGALLSSSGADGLQAVEILVACLQSNALGGAPIIWPISDR
ncbi:MAG: Gfo/Idh/MocA family oxidoreductase [Acidimicrobiales bacterium]